MPKYPTLMTQETKILPTLIEGKGTVRHFLFTQLKSSKKAYLYEVKPFYGIKHWEVYRRRVNTRFNCESFPSDKSFGLWAWCFVNYDKAIKKFESL